MITLHMAENAAKSNTEDRESIRDRIMTKSADNLSDDTFDRGVMHIVETEHKRHMVSRFGE